MMSWLHPGFILIFGALLVPLFKGKWKEAYLILPPVAALIVVVLMHTGVFGQIPFSTWHLPFLGYDLVFGKVDNLSFLFGLAFTLALVPVMIYSLHVKSSTEHMSQLIYAGSALGVVFAGDLISLYFFWELMSIASVLVIWHGATEKAHSAGYRYILWHVAGGVTLLAGIIMYISATGSITFNAFDWNSDSTFWASMLIFIGFILNAGVPPLHAWLPDAYPESTVTGSVYLSIFTTKSAVYVLARGFAGFSPLIWIGAFMTIYPIFFAVLENNLRRVLSYSIINQVGFMLCGIGMGTALAMNGATSHAFVHIIYKSLLFMSVGSVLFRTRTANITDLGGLFKTMPLTAVFCLVGAASISAFPLLSGFTTKAMVVQSAALGGTGLIFVLLLIAGAGVFEHAGIKVPFFTFFGRDSGLKAKDPPVNMLLGMGIMAFLCIFFGVYPYPLYQILPYSAAAAIYNPFTIPHVMEALELLLFAAFAFFILHKTGIYPPERRTITLDTDWPLRVLGGKVIWFAKGPLSTFSTRMDNSMKKIASDFSAFGEEKEERVYIGISVMLALLFLALYLIVEILYNWIFS
jgi:multicomponent Na+:H+ antiporter subunit D